LGALPPTPPQGAQPLDPIPQNHVHGFANGGAGESFPCWEFEGETLKKKEEV